jgi:hypothetical protein
VHLIAGLRDRAQEAAVDELLKDLLDKIRYGDYLRAEAPSRPSDSTTFAS